MTTSTSICCTAGAATFLVMSVFDLGFQFRFFLNLLIPIYMKFQQGPIFYSRDPYYKHCQNMCDYVITLSLLSALLTKSGMM